jgi:hypothetical protein
MNLSAIRNFIVTGALALTLAASMSMSGCVVVPAHRYYVGAVVTVAPPPPRREVIGVAPNRGYVWVGGYWQWTGARHDWVAGHWEAPRNGYHWVPHSWHHERDGWHLAEGHWERGR